MTHVWRTMGGNLFRCRRCGLQKQKEAIRDPFHGFGVTVFNWINGEEAGWNKTPPCPGGVEEKKW